MSYMRSEARQRQILTCAKRVFAERGFHAANVSHICEAAGIGRGTLYQYFPNKRAVLTAILRETLERAKALMERQEREAPVLAPPEKVSRDRRRSSSRPGSCASCSRSCSRTSDTLRIVLREAVGPRRRGRDDARRDRRGARSGSSSAAWSPRSARGYIRAARRARGRDDGGRRRREARARGAAQRRAGGSRQARARGGAAARDRHALGSAQTRRRRTPMATL